MNTDKKRMSLNDALCTAGAACQFLASHMNNKDAQKQKLLDAATRLFEESVNLYAKIEGEKQKRETAANLAEAGFSKAEIKAHFRDRAKRRKARRAELAKLKTEVPS